MMAADEIARRIGFPSEYIPRWFDGYHKDVEARLTSMIVPSKFRLSSVLLAGPVGTGKTSMLCAMFKGWFLNLCNQRDVEKRADTIGTVGNFISGTARAAIFMSFNDYINMVMAEIDPEKDSPGVCTEDLRNIPLLIFDNLLDPVPSPFQLSRLDYLMSCRYEERLPTWMTTNCEQAVLGNWPGFERSYDRFKDKNWCRYFELTGASRRSKT